MTFGRHMLKHWPLDPAVTYLNHGTVGVTPRVVLAMQQQIRDEMERQPSKFMLRDLSGWIGRPQADPTRMRLAAAVVASFVGAEPADLVFVDNATGGANAVLRSFPFRPGDEILVTDLGYGAVTKAAEYAARMRGAVVTTAVMPYPRFDPAAAVAAIERALTARTRVAVIDHVTSESALVLPLAQIAARCHARGVLVLADGAHAPGMLPLDLPSLGVDWYVANLHKWAHAPRSAGFLWAHPDRQTDLHPPVISWGLDEGFTTEFDWVGTRDPSPWLAAPAGIAFLEELGFDALRTYNHELAWRAARYLTDRWQTPLDIRPEHIGSMVTVPLPESLGSTADDAVRLRNALLFDKAIEVQLHAGHGRLWTRVSAQVYNEDGDIERLADAVTARRP
ncbi:MAG TPA: aminotransferase class V-fold PLP-dependent enzyme [Vicinamibacterales bacterium]|nr:aminotransferase class V-fold PLP-dependent enzyme [Vicinamibacterales bacterium]